MTVTIDGVDITNFIAFRGLKWQRNDIDDDSTGRMLDGTLNRNRIASKIRLDITCRPLKAEEAKTVLSLIMPEWVTVTYYDPQVGNVVEKTMYSNNNPASYLMTKNDGTEWWDGITFPLIEK